MEMEWLSVKDILPNNDTVCYVINAKWSTECFKAIYHKNYDVFVQLDPNLRSHPALDVTHWVALPNPFLESSN